MIKCVYKDETLWKWQHATWAASLFLIYSATLWYAIIKACFQELVVRPPYSLSAIFLALMFADRLYPALLTKRFLTFSFILDMLAWTGILISVLAPSPLDNDLCYLGLLSLVFIYDIVYLKEVLFDLVRRNYWVYKCYILIKLIYWIIMYSHFIGCIFYAIDIYLIKNEAFGPFALNNPYYYQGTLLAYTPIYMFDDLNRYIYAMYYSFALVSTIAFGDIIGKNYYEDVCLQIYRSMCLF
jgi:hypothetical protein